MSASRSIQALAFLVTEIRPAWPRAIVETTLARRCGTRQEPDYLLQLALDALDAAGNPGLASAGVLATHRRPDRPLESVSLPPVPRCQTCNHITCVCGIAAPERVREILSEAGL